MTIVIIGTSQILALLVALPVGILAAVKPYSWFDRIATTFADARAILARHGIEEPAAVRAHLAAAADETPKPGDPRLARAEAHITARTQESLHAAAAAARAAGTTPILLGDATHDAVVVEVLPHGSN